MCQQKGRGPHSRAGMLCCTWRRRPARLKAKGQLRPDLVCVFLEPHPQGVPAHDARDWNLAHVLGLPIKHVVQSSDSKTPADENGPYTDPVGTLVGSGL
jgi:hypothetical protein